MAWSFTPQKGAKKMDYSDFLKVKKGLCGDSKFDYIKFNTVATHKVIIDYNETFWQMTENLHKFDSGIQSQFPLTGKDRQEVELKIIRLDKRTKEDDMHWVFQAIFAHDMMPGKIEHLLAFNKAFPKHAIWESASRWWEVMISALGSCSVNPLLIVSYPILTRDCHGNQCLEPRDYEPWRPVARSEYFIVTTFPK